MSKHPINHDWDNYYQQLEKIREIGDTNMWGAAPYLAKDCNISNELAIDALLSWIENYTELSQQFNWR